MKIAAVLLLVTLPMVSWAASSGSDAGALELTAVSQILTGNIGLAIGLLLTVFGLFKAFVKGDTGGGILIAVCGVLLTIFPGVFNSAAALMKPITDSLSGTTSSGG